MSAGGYNPVQFYIGAAIVGLPVVLLWAYVQWDMWRRRRRSDRRRRRRRGYLL